MPRKWDATDLAFDTGYRDGVIAGQYDRGRNSRRDCQATGAYRNGNHGSGNGYGDSASYHEHYRTGFERGYRDRLGHQHQTGTGSQATARRAPGQPVSRVRPRGRGRAAAPGRDVEERAEHENADEVRRRVVLTVLQSRQVCSVQDRQPGHGAHAVGPHSTGRLRSHIRPAPWQPVGSGSDAPHDIEALADSAYLLTIAFPGRHRANLGTA
jgi:hypothetical protein